MIAGYHNPLTATGGIGTTMRMISPLLNNLHVVCVDFASHGPHSHIGNRHRVSPLPISNALADQFYRGFCKSHLWPVLHEEPLIGSAAQKNFLEHASAFAAAYSQLLFQLVDDTDPEPLIWFNDYSMLPIAAHFRALSGDRFRMGLSIRCCFGVSHPPKLEREIESLVIDGLRSVDVLTVHRARDRQHILELLTSQPQEQYSTGAPAVRVVPMGSSVDYWQRAGQSREASEFASRARDSANLQIVLAVSRLETHKAIDLELAVFDQLLRDYPHVRGSVQLKRITPVFEETRSLPQYAALLEKIQSDVRRINDLYGTATWRPIDLRTGPALTHERLAAFYRSADILMVLSRSDGFNHVSFEAVLAKQPGDPPLALMLSDTGSSDYLVGAHVSASSTDSAELARQLAGILSASRGERRAMHERLAAAALKHDVHDWLYEILGTIAAKGETSRDCPF